MKDSKIYASMILSILSSSKDKHSALRAVRQNFEFKGTLRMEIEQLFETFYNNERKLISEFIRMVDQFNNNEYPYIANIILKPSRSSQSYSS